MGLRKCPKCELNYIRDDQKYCDVCSRKHKLSEHDDEEPEELLCAECGEHPVMSGKKICKYCYKEKLRQQKLLKNHPDVSSVDNIDDIDDEGANDTASPDYDEISEAEMDEEDEDYDEAKEDFDIGDDYDNKIYIED